MKSGDLVFREVQGVRSKVFGIGVVLGASEGYRVREGMYQVAWTGCQRFPGRVTWYTPVENLIPVEERVA